MTTAAEHEEAAIRAFIQRDKQDRCIFLLAHPRRRRKFTSGLAHFGWLDQRRSHPIPPQTAHGADEVVSLLRSRGAGPTVWIISENSSIDGQELELEEAVHQVWGCDMGTIVSCIPGKLGLFQGEDMKSARLLEVS